MNLENAFNRIDGSCFLREARRSGLVRFCDLCCSSDSFVMMFGREKIPSTRRVQLGDSLYLLLFALGLHRIISEDRAQVEAIDFPEVAAFDLDDGTICSSHKATRACLAGLQRGLGDRGLQQNPVSTNASRCWEPPANSWKNSTWRRNLVLLGFSGAAKRG